MDNVILKNAIVPTPKVTFTRDYIGQVYHLIKADRVGCGKANTGVERCWVEEQVMGFIRRGSI